MFYCRVSILHRTVLGAQILPVPKCTGQAQVPVSWHPRSPQSLKQWRFFIHYSGPGTGSRTAATVSQKKSSTLAEIYFSDEGSPLSLPPGDQLTTPGKTNGPIDQTNFALCTHNLPDVSLTLFQAIPSITFLSSPRTFSAPPVSLTQTGS